MPAAVVWPADATGDQRAGNAEGRMGRPEGVDETVPTARRVARAARGDGELEGVLDARPAHTVASTSPGDRFSAVQLKGPKVLPVGPYGTGQPGVAAQFRSSSLNGVSFDGPGSWGRPSTRSPMMLRCTWSLPP